MKNLTTIYCLLLFTCLLLLGSCKGQTKTEKPFELPFVSQSKEANVADFAAIQFDKIEYNFGKVQAGASVKCSFKFTNTSTKPLIISEVAPQCGCTTTHFPKEPIAANGTGEITLELATKDQKGMIEKNARVVANIEGGLLFLFMKGEVISDELLGVPPGSPR